MANSFESRGGGFAGDTGETQAPEYRTILKSSLSPEQQATYVSAIQKLGGFNGTKWEAKITKYFDENDYVIDLQQEGLNQFYLREIFNQYSDDQEDTIPEVEDESYKKYLNNRSAETSKRYDSGLEDDRLNVSKDEQLEVESNYPYPTRFASESDYGDKSVLSDWLLIEKNSQEHELLIKGIKDKGLIPSLKLLNQIHPEIRRLKQNKEVSGKYLEFINATRELYGLAPYGSISEELAEIDPEVNQPDIKLEVAQEPILAVDPESGTTPASEGLAEGGVNETKKLTRADFAPMPEDPYDIKNNDLEALNNLFVSKADQFPNGKYVDIRNWAYWTPITVVKPENINDPNLQWSITKGNNNELIGEFPSEEDAEAEFNRIKNEDKQKALDLLRKARNFAIGVDLDTPWSDVIDVSSETVMGAESAVTPLLDAETTSGVGTPNPEVDEFQAPDSENGGEALLESGPLEDGLDGLVEEITTQERSSVDENSNTLQQELDRLIVETDQRLSKESEPNKEKLERFKDNARQAISNFQQFVRDHSSPADKSNPQIQERYQLLEKYAWNSLYSLAHLLDGEIATLPQDRDIQLSHPGGVNTRQYLEARGYKFDENGDITHITDNGVEIELNRAMKTDSLIKSKRPSHIVYDKSISLDNDINYQGYLVRGLNQQTPDFIVGVLDKNNLEPVIVDETGQSTVPTTEAKQDPWSTESRGDTEFEKIFAGNLSRNKDTQGNNEIPDPWVEKAVIEEPPIIPVFPIPSGDNSDLQSEGAYPLGEEGLETTPQVSLDDLRLAYARAEEAWNRKRGDLKLENAFESAREDYNTELERVLKLQVAEGQEANIHQIFKDEFIALRDSRVVQSKELQGKWEKRLNPIKEKFVNFVIKHKKIISRLNLAAGVAGGALALTGVGIPLAGGLAVARRMVSATLLGVSTGEGIRSLGEDADINSFWGKIKFQAVIPKLVQESLASSEDEFKQVSGDVLKERLGTLEAYYRLNGGGFTNDNQRQAYEKVLTELARRVQENVIYVENNKDTLQSDWQKQKPQELTDVEIKNLADENLSKRNIIAKSIPFSRNREIEIQYDLDYEKYINWEKLNPERYTSELLNTISDKRIVELDKFRKNRKTATIAGLGVGLLAGGAVHLSDEFNKPDSVELTDGSDSTSGDPTPEVGGAGSGSGGTGGAGAPEAGVGVTKTIPDASPAGTGAEATEALRQQAAAAANEAREVLAQDVSSLDSGETIWSQASKWLGPDASQGQIQEAVEKYLGSIKGQDTIFKLANQTEGGRELLSQWGVDNAGEMAGLSKEQLYEVSKYLGEGKLDGITELSLDNLDALEQAEYVAPSPTEAPTIEPGSTEAPPAGTEDIGSKPPAPSSPPAPEVSPVASTEFTRGVSEALGTTNLTETQLQEAIYSFATSEQGSVNLYKQIISNKEGARFLSGFGVDKAADFANIRPDRVYEIAQTVGVDNLDKLPGFELNEIILSKFEDAPDMVELSRGTRPLDVVQRYIANELGNLPYDSNLGKQVLDTYIQTDTGKLWLYDAIVSKPNPNNQNVQLFREYLRFEDIKSPGEFVSKFNWVKFSGNRNIPTSGFWNQIRLPNVETKLQPLSTFLQPSKMIGIKDAVRQVLTRQ